MNNFIQEILNDLFMLDPELKKHEKELIVLAKTFLESRPDTKFDSKFAAELKAELMERAQALKSSPTVSTGKPGLLSAFFANKFAYAAAGAIITLIVIFPFIKSGTVNKLSQDSENLAINFNGGITKVKDSAFGDLSTDNQVAEAATGLGGGGGFARTQSGGGAGLAAPQTESIAASDSSAKMIAPRPDRINYEYAYVGDDININDNQMAVYKRTKNAAGGQALAQSITGFDFDLLDLSQFKDTELTNLNLNENRDFGYSLYLNLTENTLDINQNWQKWPHPEQSCRDEACFNRYRLKIDDVPTDDKILSIANNFIKEYGIDISNLGEPFVQDQWHRQYELVEDKSLAYVPDEMSVIYPLIIEGKIVYDQSGNPTGMYVGVNIRQNRVSDTHSLRPQTFESSVYDIVNESDKIIEFAEQGGLWPRHLYESADKIITVELGTPQSCLLQYWKYDYEDGTSQELYIPALIFPVKNFTELGTNYYQENIVVPLIEDMLDKIRPPLGIPEPMPLIKAEVQSMEAGDSEVMVDAPAVGEVKGESATVEPKEIQTHIRLESD